ncbi:hypothetical protein LSH36_36g08071 [Paralvinella palmiformis]|uniref:Uncharacterized protein n=1 Tax=Paralvinella palmiformis TaxID=53620 RepID=A0AAD9NGX7_9ANNE|nr:hypothetical protein LSH36_36g08071 [Paralvinella palmiformis]
MKAVRTNNVVEDWHQRFNSHTATASLQLYVLVPLLHHEACVVHLHMRL